MDKKKLEEMIKKREEIKQQLEYQYQQIIGQIAVLKELLEELNSEKIENIRNKIQELLG